MFKLLKNSRSKNTAVVTAGNYKSLESVIHFLNVILLEGQQWRLGNIEDLKWWCGSIFFLELLFNHD